MGKLLCKNLISKPGRLAAELLSVLFAVAVLFTVLAFPSSVSSYFRSVRTQDCGDADVKISYSVGDTRVMNASEVSAVVDAEYVVGVLSVYGTSGGKYVNLKGAELSDLLFLNDVEISSGDSLDKLRSDEVVVSESFAQSHGVKIADRMEIDVLGKTKSVYIGAIATDSGLFDPIRGTELVLASDGLVSSYFSSAAAFGKVYNEIYVKLASGSVDEAIAALENSPQFSGMTVERALNEEKLAQDSSLHSATVVVVGVVVVLVAAAVILFLALIKYNERSSQIAKLKTMGASGGQLFALYFSEALIVGVVGAALGLVFARLVLTGIFRLSFGAAFQSVIPSWCYAVAFFAGLALYAVAEALPLVAASRRSVRGVALEAKNTQGNDSPRLFFVLTALLAVSLTLEFTVQRASGVLGFLSIVLLLLWTVSVSSVLLRALGWVCAKIPHPSVAIAARSAQRDRATKIKVRVLSVGSAVCILLLLASSVMSVFFGSYNAETNDSVMLENLPADTSAVQAEIASYSGVTSVAKVYWEECELSFGSTTRSIQIFGMNGSTDKLFNFEYITENAVVENILSDSTADSVICDYAYYRAFGLDIGDEITLMLGGKSVTFSVGGFVRTQYNVGNYVLANSSVLSRAFGTPDGNTLYVRTDGSNPDLCSELREAYSPRNFYVVSMKEAESVALSAVNSMFTFIDLICYFIAALTLLAVVINVLLTRASRTSERTKLLLAGSSKGQLFGSEFLVHLFIAAVSFLLSFGVSALMMRCLFDAVLVFGLYYEYIFDFGIALTAAGVMAAAVALMPVVFAYWRDYSIKIEVLKVN